MFSYFVNSSTAMDGQAVSSTEQLALYINANNVKFAARLGEWTSSHIPALVTICSQSASYFLLTYLRVGLLGCISECDVIGQPSATSVVGSGCLSRGADERAPVREVHRVTFAEDRNKYLNADEQLCDGLDFELELRLSGHRASDDDDVELIPRHSIIKLPKPPRLLLLLLFSRPSDVEQWSLNDDDIEVRSLYLSFSRSFQAKRCPHIHVVCVYIVFDIGSHTCKPHLLQVRSKVVVSPESQIDQKSKVIICTIKCSAIQQH